MNKTEQDAFWNSQVSKLKKAGLLKKSVPPHQGYRQKLHSWKSSDITLNAGCDDRGEWVHVDITMTGNFRLSWFARLKTRQKDLEMAVENDLGKTLNGYELEWIWDPRDDGARESWIILRCHGLDLSDRKSCQIGQEWIKQTVGSFFKHFGPLLDTL